MLQAEIPEEPVPERSSVKLAVFAAVLCSDEGRHRPSVPRRRGRRGWRLAALSVPFPRGHGTEQTSCFSPQTFSLAQAARWVRKALLPSPASPPPNRSKPTPLIDSYIVFHRKKHLSSTAAVSLPFPFSFGVFSEDLHDPSGSCCD